MKDTTKIIQEGRVMAERDLYNIPEMPAANPVIINEEKCNGCNRCVNICQVDLFIPDPEKGKPPFILYPGECWYCGCCVVECPVEGCIELRHPLMNRVHWILKDQLK